AGVAGRVRDRGAHDHARRRLARLSWAPRWARPRPSPHAGDRPSSPNDSAYSRQVLVLAGYWSYRRWARALSGAVCHVSRGKPRAGAWAAAASSRRRPAPFERLVALTRRSFSTATSTADTD